MTRAASSPSPTRARVPWTQAVLCAALLLGCADGEAFTGPEPAGDPAEFEASVYPVLLRDCAFSECHGSRHRFFQVYGPGRVRLDPASASTDPATPAEISFSYQRALAMLATDARATRSLLLRKPLEPNAGGQGHAGLDTLGRNVYQSPFDPAYAAIEAFALHAAALGGRTP
jgi:hypothetical protein